MAHVPLAGEGDEQRADASHNAKDVPYERLAPGMRREWTERYTWTLWCSQVRFSPAGWTKNGTSASKVSGCPRIRGGPFGVVCPIFFCLSSLFLGMRHARGESSFFLSLPLWVGGSVTSICAQGPQGPLDLVWTALHEIKIISNKTSKTRRTR